MLGIGKSAQTVAKEFAQSPEFQTMLGEQLVAHLAKSEMTNAIGKRLDEMFSSIAVTHKLFSSIEKELEKSGLALVQQKLPGIFESEEVKTAVTSTTAIAIRQVLERIGDKAFSNHLSRHEVQQSIRDHVKQSVRSSFDSPDIQTQILKNTGIIVEQSIGTLVEERVQQQVETPEVRQAIETIVANVVNTHLASTFPRLRRYERQDGSISAVIHEHSEFDKVFRACQAPGANVLLVGPAGTGKTQIAQGVAEALGKPFYFNGSIQSEYKLLGFRDATGRYNPTPFYNAFTRGGVYLFDEIDASSAQALVAFNTAIANRICDFPSDGEPVPASPDFLCMAAANTYGRGANHLYNARNQLDAATLDRFVVIHIGYDEAMELNLTDNKKWVKKVQKWRARAAELDIRHVISMRASIMGAKLLKTMSEAEVEEMVVWRGLDPNTVSKIRNG